MKSMFGKHIYNLHHSKWKCVLYSVKKYRTHTHTHSHNSLGVFPWIWRSTSKRRLCTN